MNYDYRGKACVVGYVIEVEASHLIPKWYPKARSQQDQVGQMQTLSQTSFSQYNTKPQIEPHCNNQTPRMPNLNSVGAAPSSTSLPRNINSNRSRADQQGSQVAECIAGGASEIHRMSKCVKVKTETGPQGIYPIEIAEE